MREPMQASTPSTEQPIQYDGKTGELYKIFFLNLFLGIITLGIYHFWGKTRTRRYVTSSFHIQEDRFEYTGYGGELFWGFIKALVLLLIISIPFIYSLYEFDKLDKKVTVETTQTEETQIKNKQGKTLATIQSTQEQDFTRLSPEELRSYKTYAAIMFCYALFYYMYLPFVAIFGSLRYRITRTRWRGIRGHLKGCMWIYGLVGLGHLLLSIVTLGVWIPFADLMKFKYKAKRFYFGSQQAHFTPEYGKLFIAHILTGFPIILSLIAIFALSMGMLEQGNSQPYKEAMYLAIAVLFFTIFVIRFWYKATLLRIQYNNLTFGNIGFDCKITGFALFRQIAGNALILIFTLGLGYPLVTQRRMRFFCKHVTLKGDVQKMVVSQASGEKDNQGEGLSTLFDLNIGLF